jgi:thioredoxin reductase
LSVHHCPDCDGYEVKDKQVAVLAPNDNSTAFAANFLTWTKQVTLLTDEHEISEDDRANLADLGIPVRTEAVVALDGDKSTGQLRRVLFAEGEPLECDALFFNLGTQLASNFHETLGCRVDPESGLVWVDRTRQTSVENVYAAGDITPNSQLAVVAAAEGAMAAIHIHRSLVSKERQL